MDNNTTRPTEQVEATEREYRVDILLNGRLLETFDDEWVGTPGADAAEEVAQDWCEFHNEHFTQTHTVRFFNEHGGVEFDVECEFEPTFSARPATKPERLEAVEAAVAELRAWTEAGGHQWLDDALAAAGGDQ